MAARAHPEFHGNHAQPEVLTVTFEGMRTLGVRYPSLPVSEKDWVDRHRTSTFIAVKPEIPSAASPFRIHSKGSLVGYFKRRIAVMLVKRTFLKLKCENVSEILVWSIYKERTMQMNSRSSSSKYSIYSNKRRSAYLTFCTSSAALIWG